MKKKLGIYIHIPFCIRKCDYCDFLSFTSGKEERERYAEALKREIAEGINAGDDSLGSSTGSGKTKDNWLVTSIFFGGGTPSVLEGEIGRASCRERVYVQV